MSIVTKYTVMDVNAKVLAQVTVEADDVHVTAVTPTAAHMLNALMRLPGLHLPVSDRLTNGDTVIRYDVVNADDDRWPSALAYALGVGYRVSVAADETVAGAENENK